MSALRTVYGNLGEPSSNCSRRQSPGISGTLRASVEERACVPGRAIIQNRHCLMENLGRISAVFFNKRQLEIDTHHSIRPPLAGGVFVEMASD